MTTSGGRVLELLGPSSGGIRRHVDVLARHLGEHAWQPTVAGPPGVMDALGSDAVTVPVGLRPADAATAVRRIRRLAADADVVHAHGLTAGWLAAAAHTGRPVVVTIHNIVLAETSGRSAPVLRRLEAGLPGRVDWVIAVSSEIADRFPRWSDRIQVIVPAGPAPVVARDRATIRVAAGVGEGDPLVVTVARLHPQKAVGDLLDAAARVRVEVPEVRFVVVGDGPERASLVAEARRRGVDDVVTFVGGQPDGPSWMAAADVVAVSSIWEGSPIVVAEALQLGRPLVATDVGDVAEAVHDGVTGRLLAPSQPALLAEAITSMLSDRPAAEAMARTGQELATARYGTTALVAAVADVYRRLAGTDPPRGVPRAPSPHGRPTV
jgi:glycosyltransferase involved in cell wall biosynthesis